MPVSQYIQDPNYPIVAPVATATAVNVGDLVAVQSGAVVPASGFTWNTDLVTTQTAFAAAFVGHSFQFKGANVARVFGNSEDNTLGVSSAGTYEFDCAAANFTLGQYVGVAKNPAANALLDQTVVGVGSAAAAIGQVVLAGVNLTRVRVRLLSGVLPLSK